MATTVLRSEFRQTDSETTLAPHPATKVEELPNELLFIIFRLLSPRDQEAAICVCRKWKEVGETPSLKMVREFRFGKSKWKRYFGDIGVEPPFPANIAEILNSPCLFWPNKRVRDTHLLVLIPNTVDGRPFHLNSLSELIKRPKTGHKTEYDYYSDYVKDELGTKSAPSHWALMTRDVIPGSRSKTYDDQKRLVASHAQRSGIPYALPLALDAATALLMHHVETGERLYSNKPLTYTRCQENVNQNQWSAAIGGFSSVGLDVYYDSYIVYDFSGVGGFRKL